MTSILNPTGRTPARFRFSALCVAACCLQVAANAAAQTPSSASADAEVVRPFLGDTTFLVLKVDSKKIGLPDLDKALESLPPDAKTVSRQVSAAIDIGIKQFQSTVDNQPIYATFGIPITPTRMSTFLFMKKPSEPHAEQLSKLLNQQFQNDTCVHGDYLVATPVNGVDAATALADSPSSPRDTIVDAFESIQGYPAQVLLLPPPHVWRTFRELSTDLPKQMGGGPSSIVTEGILWAALGVDPVQLRAQLIIQSASDSAAADLAARLPGMLLAAYDAAPQLQKRMPQGLVQALLGWLDPQVTGSRIHIQMDGLKKTNANLVLLATLAQSVEDRTRRNVNAKSFKQILLGMHNYYDVHGTFPPVDKYRNKDGKHHLSWRVHILPFVGEIELYQAFRLDEPWDSPHNKKLVSKIPDVYRSHSFDIPPKVTVKPGHTTFLAPTGNATIFGGTEATKFHHVIDGSSNTIALVEVKPQRAVPWTAPDDYQFDPDDPATGILIGPGERWLCAYADGSVHQLRSDIAPATIRNLFLMNDRNVIDHKKIR